MSATIKGLGSFDIEPQPGFDARLSDNGGWTGSHSFIIRRSAWANPAVRSRFRQGTSITSLDPALDSSWSFISVVEVTAVVEEGDLMRVSVSLSGPQGAQYGEDGLSDTAAPTYRLSGYLQEAPLSSHHKWPALSELEKEALGLMLTQSYVYDPASNKVGTRDERSFWPEENSEGTEYVLTSADAIEFAKLIAVGETTYQRPVSTWTETTQGSTGLTPAQTNKLGKTSIPRGGPPEPNGDRDWMLTNLSQDQLGDLFSTTLEWTLSERGGHNAFLYDD